MRMVGGQISQWWDEKVMFSKNSILGLAGGWFLGWPLLEWLFERTGGWTLQAVSFSVTADLWKMAVGVLIGLVLMAWLRDKWTLITFLGLGLLSRLGLTAWLNSAYNHTGVVTGRWYLVMEPVTTAIQQAASWAMVHLVGIVQAVMGVMA